MFTEVDHLRLLQLKTKHDLAERRKREDLGIPVHKGGERLALEFSSPVITERWRLVPDGVELYAWQKECLERWLKQGRGTVKVATGGGKTLFALAAAQRLQNDRVPELRLVIVVPTIPLMYQWWDEVRRGNLPDSAIGLLGGGRDPRVLRELRVLICVLNSARKKLPDLVKHADWSSRMLLVVDECHRANAAQARRVFEANPAYTLGLSATPESQEDSGPLPTNEVYERSAVGRGLGPMIYDFTIKDSLAAGLLTPFEVWHVGLPLSTAEAGEHARLSREITHLRKTLQRRHRSTRSKQGFLAWCQTQASRGGPAAAEAQRFIGLANRRKRLLYQAEWRTQVVLEILAESVTDPERRTIVFHESIEEIEALFLRALERGLPAVLEHSKLPDGLRAENIEAFRRGIARIIISAKSLIEGFNVPSADLGIIAASSSSVRQRIQSLGRMLRRKPGGRTAQIIVIYVRDTEDEAIYEKADWQNVVGAERNRYFEWVPGRGKDWRDGLEETGEPPRSYRLPSWQVDVSKLEPGSPYPGQAHGQDLRVDQAGNLRTRDGVLVKAPRELVDAILEQRSDGRARCTPAGHLIVRVDRGKGKDWRFLGEIDVPVDSSEEKVVRLRVKTVSGKRQIARQDDEHRGALKFALVPDESPTPEGGRARNRLLEWIRSVERKYGVGVKELLWNGESRYWLEIKGERIEYDEPIAPLEFTP